MTPDVRFVEISPSDGDDELLTESVWARRLDRLLVWLLPRTRARALIIAAVAVFSVATFGGTHGAASRLATAPTGRAAATTAQVDPTSTLTVTYNVAATVGDLDGCTDEWVYKEDPTQPGVRPYEQLFCTPVRLHHTR